MLKPAVKKKWVKALRSGQYAQGHGSLASPGETHDRFCCLGVLQNIAIEAGVFDYEGDADTAALWKVWPPFMPSIEVLEWAGLMRDGYPTALLLNDLVRLNDGYVAATGLRMSHPKTFNEIADWIEENL